MRSKVFKSSSGLSIVETIFVLAILTVGVSTLVGTAIYAFGNYNKALLRLTALGLAREGVEVVRNIRDTNWLPPKSVENCADSGEGDIGPEQLCYKDWLVNLENCENGCQAVFNTSLNEWTVESTSNYALYLQNNSLYTNQSNGGTPVYYRKIRIIPNPQEPYTEEHPELKILSTVAWVGRGCLNDFSGNPDNAHNRCKITVEDRLTNWKNY
jgi:hypothetical protein